MTNFQPLYRRLVAVVAGFSQPNTPGNEFGAELRRYAHPSRAGSFQYVDHLDSDAQFPQARKEPP